MKNVILLSLIILLPFVSCKSDDDNGSSTLDYSAVIIGEWDLTDYQEDGVSEYDANDCDQQVTIEFNNSAVLTVQEYETIGTSCLPKVSFDSFNYSVQANVLSVVDGSTITNSTFAFSNNNNTFTIIEVDGNEVLSYIYTRQ